MNHSILAYLTYLSLKIIVFRGIFLAICVDMLEKIMYLCAETQAKRWLCQKQSLIAANVFGGHVSLYIKYCYCILTL